jgi:hypothetical protein
MSMAEPSATSVPPPIAAPKSADIAAFLGRRFLGGRGRGLPVGAFGRMGGH